MFADAKMAWLIRVEVHQHEMLEGRDRCVDPKDTRTTGLRYDGAPFQQWLRAENRQPGDVPSALAELGTPNPGRMSPITAGNFALLGTALLLARGWVWAGQLAA